MNILTGKGVTHANSIKLFRSPYIVFYLKYLFYPEIY